MDIPHAVDGVGAGGDLEVVAWLEGGDGLDEGVAVGVGVLDGAFWFGGGPRRVVGGGGRGGGGEGEGEQGEQEGGAHGGREDGVCGAARVVRLSV